MSPDDGELLAHASVAGDGEAVRAGGVAGLGRLFEDYPGLRLLTMDALYAERDLCRAIVSHGRDYLVRVKGNQPTVLSALVEGFAGAELGEPEAETVEKKRG